MKLQPVSIWFGAMLMLVTAAVHADQASPQTASQNPCALLKPEDLTKLMGSKPVAKQNKTTCTWTITGKPNTLAATKFPGTGMAAEMAFEKARNNVAKKGTVIDVYGVGDRSFASTGTFGVVALIIQQGKLLQLKYTSGAPGSDKDIEALKPVAVKAIAAFK
jgi:hypothetical protein